MRLFSYLLPDTRDVPSIVMTEIALALFILCFLTHAQWAGWAGLAVFAAACVYHAFRFAVSLALTAEETR